MRHAYLIPLAALVAVLIVAASATLAGLSLADGDGPADLTGPRLTDAPSEPDSDRDGDRDLRDAPPRREPDPPGRARRAQQPFIGVSLTERDGHVVIVEVVPGSPAARAGIEPGDRIAAVNGSPVRDPAQVVERVRGTRPGDALNLVIVRGDEEFPVSLRVGQRPGRVDLFEPPPEPPFESPFDLPPDFPFENALELFDLPRLLERFGERFERLVDGEIRFLDDAGEVTSLRLTAGALIGVSAEGIAVEPRGGGGPQEFRITDETRILLGARPARPDELHPGDTVIVLSRDGAASLIFALPTR